jgi:hypothetical protein
MERCKFFIHGKELTVNGAFPDANGLYHGKLHEEGKDNEKDIVIKNFDYYIVESD